MTTPAFAGQTYLIRFDNGTVFRNTYSTDGATLHYDTVEGAGAGGSEDVSLHTAAVGGRSYLVNWVEANSTTVTHLMNLDDATVHAFWTFDGHRGRVGELHTAGLEKLGTAVQS
ncbi:MAG: MoaF-related domain-containing protein [Motilibacteraceae bacterium]